VIIRLVCDPARGFGLQIPLFRAPAACWCARAAVESTLTSQQIRPAASARLLTVKVATKVSVQMVFFVVDSSTGDLMLHRSATRRRFKFTSGHPANF
jgi:hypothetical protein